MKTRNIAPGLFFLVAYVSLALVPALALEAIPLYETVSIGGLLRGLYPTAGISAPSALNAEGDTVGRAVIDGQYQAFVYTEENSVVLLTMLDGWTSAVASDISDRDPVTGWVLIVGAAQSSIYGDPERAVLWEYDPVANVVLQTTNIGLPPGSDFSTATSVNNRGWVVGYGRGSGWLAPYQPFVYDFASGSLHELNIPFNPFDINNSDIPETEDIEATITGGTHRARLTLPAGGSTIEVSNIEDLRTAERPSVSRTTALNDANQVVGVTSMGYSDGAGRIVAGCGALQRGLSSCLLGCVVGNERL